MLKLTVCEGVISFIFMSYIAKGCAKPNINHVEQTVSYNFLLCLLVGLSLMSHLRRAVSTTVKDNLMFLEPSFII